MEESIFKAAIIIYFLSMVGYFASLVAKRVLVAKAATWILLAGFTVHTASFILKWSQAVHGPVVNIFEAFSFIAWSVAGVYLVFQLKSKTRVLGALVSPVVVVLSIIASTRVAGDGAIPAVLAGPWVAAHAVLTLAGGGLLALASLAGVMYLVQDSLIRGRRSYGVTRFLPSLKELDRINHISITAGFVLLTFGIIAGAVWARTAWGHHWQWDPKQVATLLSWLVYAVIFHQRLALGWKGRKIAVLSIVAFIILLFTIAGVNVFFVTVHDFT